MKSIKPGRGPSMMGGFMGIIVLLFAIFWTVIAASMGAGIMVPFGILFIIVAIGITVYNFKNATSKNRYSSFDITDDKEEPDPLNERFGKNSAENEKHSDGLKFCPYCGAKVENGHQFCGECGKKLY